MCQPVIQAQKNNDISEVMELVEIYAKHYNAVDGWSGKVLASSILTPAYEAKKNLEKALGQLIKTK